MVRGWVEIHLVEPANYQDSWEKEFLGVGAVWGETVPLQENLYRWCLDWFRRQRDHLPWKLIFHQKSQFSTVLKLHLCDKCWQWGLAKTRIKELVCRVYLLLTVLWQHTKCSPPDCVAPPVFQYFVFCEITIFRDYVVSLGIKFSIDFLSFIPSLLGWVVNWLFFL